MKILLSTLVSLMVFAGPALAKETLTIYTYESFVTEWGPGAKIKAAFEETCDCTIEWVTAGDGVATLNRLKLEGANTRADIVLGLDTSLTAEAAATGLFGPHGVDKTRAKTPTPWTDDYFMPFDFAHFAVIYDTEKIKTPPKSLDELVNGDANLKIVLQDPRSSTTGLGFLLWMKSVYGDKSAEAWQKLQPRILTFTPGWDEAYVMFYNGEVPMVLSYTTSPIYHMVVENKARYQAAVFSEGHYFQVEVAGLIATSPERKLAESFLQFMMLSQFQDLIPTNNWMLPAGETKVALPEAFKSIAKPPKTLLFSPEVVLKNRRAWTDEWRNALSK